MLRVCTKVMVFILWRVYTIYANCREIKNLFARALETSSKANMCGGCSSLFRNKCNYLFSIIYVYYVYPAMSNGTTKTSNFSEKTRNERRYSRLQDGPLSRSRYTVTISDLSLYMKQVQWGYHLYTRRIKQKWSYSYCKKTV